MKRRSFFKAAGAGMALPWMDSLGGFAHGASGEEGPRRLLLICLPLGIYREAFVPGEAGRGYVASEYLSLLEDFREDFTVISGMEHPGVIGGHTAEARIFTGVPSNKKNVRSLDQYVAKQVGQHTRYDSLSLSAGRNIFSWTDGGTMVPAEMSMAKVFAKLFVGEDAASVKNVVRDIEHGKGIMALVNGQAKALKPKLSSADQEKLEEYFESVGEMERRLVKSESWVHRPKPEVDAEAPVDPVSKEEIVGQLRNVCDMTYLAFKTDSTRVVSFGYFQQNNVNIEGVTNGYHPLSHHGMDPGNIAQLKLIEEKFFVELRRLLGNLKETKEGDSNLLERTTIVVTSNLGNASNHSNKDLPVLLAGGRFNHGQHIVLEKGKVPLSNLYVNVLNGMGFADKAFGMSDGTVPGVEVG